MQGTRLVRQSPYTAAQMYALVQDVARYPEFVPYCTGARVRGITEQPDGTQVMQADLMVQYQIVRERYTSDVLLAPASHSIVVNQAHGPFKRLDNRWAFTDTQNGCEIDFYLDFEFRIPLLRRVIKPIMGEAVEKFVRAFETRADALYG